jgi:hypothetical protein
MVHANWISGKDMKKAALARNGLWIARRGGGPGEKGEGKGKRAGGGTQTNWTCVAPNGVLMTTGTGASAGTGIGGQKSTKPKPKMNNLF